MTSESWIYVNKTVKNFAMNEWIRSFCRGIGVQHSNSGLCSWAQYIYVLTRAVHIGGMIFKIIDYSECLWRFSYTFCEGGQIQTIVMTTELELDLIHFCCWKYSIRFEIVNLCSNWFLTCLISRISFCSITTVDGATETRQNCVCEQCSWPHTNTISIIVRGLTARTASFLRLDARRTSHT